jgi:outer membrane protein assembly factor BamB/ABC-type phosphate/phosphonate transport system substrate-binding protein
LGGLFAAALSLLLACRAEENLSNPRSSPPAESSALRIVVMDPLSEQLACDCVAGYAQRKYDRLGEFLEKKLARKVEIAYAEALSSPHASAKQGIDLIIGKFSVVVFDAGRAGLDIRTVAMLTGKEGTLTQTGLFVVRQADPARSIEDLKGYRLLFGPEDSHEKRGAALASLEAFDLPPPEEISSSPSCNTAALAVAEQDADAAVISSYAMPLLEGCGTIDKGTLRIVGDTDPVPFVGVFVTDRVGPEEEKQLAEALLEVCNHPDLLTAMESSHGFFRLPAVNGDGDEPVEGWTDWRGPNRDAISTDVPEKLPAEKRLLWARTLTGPGMSGLAVDAGYVVVADKDLYGKQDVFRCLDADTGRQIWKLAYPAAGQMDFTNSPRANPVIHKGLVYLLGAFGDLHCVKLDSGKVVWKKHLVNDFDSKLPMWGFASTPLIVDDKLIVNPGAEEASLAALDRRTGNVLWATPGDRQAYASFILAEFGGVRQVVGYDVISLGGWDPATGKRLWRLVPELEGDFNVPTPIAVGEKLLVSTENNGTRLYGFDSRGRIRPEPLAANEELAPDTSSPVVIDGMVFGSFGGVMCLDLEAGLKTLWENVEDDLAHYCSFIAGDGRVLVTTQTGKLYLLRADKEGFDCVSSLELFEDVPDTERDVWSHPALVGNRLYVRNLLGVYCFLIE